EYLMGHYPQAETWILSALESARKSHNEYAVAVDYSALGDVYQAELRFTEAEEAYGKAISMLRHQREQAHALAIVWRNLGGALIAEGRFEEALKDVNEASRLIKHNKLKDPKLEALILNTRGLPSGVGAICRVSVGLYPFREIFQLFAREHMGQRYDLL